jgi:hypothetical protein
VQRLVVGFIGWLDLLASFKCFKDALEQLFYSLHVFFAFLYVLLLSLHCLELPTKSKIQHNEKKDDCYETDESVAGSCRVILGENWQKE